MFAILIIYAAKKFLFLAFLATWALVIDDVAADRSNSVVKVVELPGGVSMDMIWLNPGSFTMGSPKSETDRDRDELQPIVRSVSEGFYLGKCEVTQAQWFSVMKTRPWAEQAFVEVGPAFPASYISWYEAVEFTRMLNHYAGEQIYRLPTEMEWEFACRAGTTTPWSSGQDARVLTDYAVFRPNTWNEGTRAAQAVAGKLPNPWGLYDMHGNVWEWVSDSYHANVSVLRHDVGSQRISRGGNFYTGAHALRSASRGSGPSNYKGSGVGFRLLREDR